MNATVKKVPTEDSVALSKAISRAILSLTVSDFDIAQVLRNDDPDQAPVSPAAKAIATAIRKSEPPVGTSFIRYDHE